jgi:hypothetical protein
VRPTLLQWLRYAVTGSAPPHLSEWVLHDVTARTWLLRHTLRFFLYLAPLIVVAMLVLPAPWPLRIGCVLIGVLGSVALSFGYTVEGAERRAEKAGYAYGTAQKIRDERGERKQRETAARLRAKREARWAARSR